MIRRLLAWWKARKADRARDALIEYHTSRDRRH